MFLTDGHKMDSLSTILCTEVHCRGQDGVRVSVGPHVEEMGQWRGRKRCGVGQNNQMHTRRLQCTSSVQSMVHLHRVSISHNKNRAGIAIVFDVVANGLFFCVIAAQYTNTSPAETKHSLYPTPRSHQRGRVLVYFRGPRLCCAALADQNSQHLRRCTDQVHARGAISINVNRCRSAVRCSYG
jgi:hypothetical protein